MGAPKGKLHTNVFAVCAAAQAPCRQRTDHAACRHGAFAAPDTSCATFLGFDVPLGRDGPQSPAHHRAEPLGAGLLGLGLAGLAAVRRRKRAA
jgi:hypothetical protein